MSFSSAPRPEEPMQPDQPTPDQLASFDQTFAELGANLDALLDTFGAMVTDGEQPDLATAGMAQWLFVNHDAATLGEHLAAAVRRLHDRERAAYERGLAEGRRQATEGWEREHLWGVVLDHGDEPQYKCGSEEDARSFALTRPGSRVVRQTTARLVGPWEPAEQPEPVKILSYHYGPEPGAMWCYGCGGRVYTFDGHAVCGCGAQLCESPADCGDDACPYRPASGGVVEPVCTCARVDIAGAPGTNPGAHHYVPGRVDPHCPFHAEPSPLTAEEADHG